VFVVAVQNIKKKFPVVLDRINELIDRLHALGPDASVDVDQAALRVTLDVIGLVSMSDTQRCHSAVPVALWSHSVTECGGFGLVSMCSTGATVLWVAV
jgi:hypothetical protein